jgi:hypothetical protein
MEHFANLQQPAGNRLGAHPFLLIGQQEAEYRSLDLQHRVAIFVAELAVQPVSQSG